MDTLEPTLPCGSDKNNALTSAGGLDSGNKLNSKPGAVGHLVGAEGTKGHKPTCSFTFHVKRKIKRVA